MAHIVLNKDFKRLPEKNSEEARRILVNFERRLREIDKKADAIEQRILGGHKAEERHNKHT